MNGSRDRRRRSLPARQGAHQRGPGGHGRHQRRVDPKPGGHPHAPHRRARRARRRAGRARRRQGARRAGPAPGDIDLVLVATSTAVDRSPNMAARVAARLGIPSPAAMDLNVVCAGFTHALATADHAVRAGRAAALVIGADKMSDVTDWTDRTTCVLVGDGAGAAVVDRRRRRRAAASGPCCGVRCPRWGTRYGSRAPLAVRAGGPERLPLGHHRSCRRSPARPASAPASPPRTSPPSSCTRPTCASSSPWPRRSAR